MQLSTVHYYCYYYYCLLFAFFLQSSDYQSEVEQHQQEGVRDMSKHPKGETRKLTLIYDILH